MKKRSQVKLISAVTAGVLCLVLLLGMFASPVGQAVEYHASYIERNTDLPALNLSDYLDNSVMFKLPSTVKDDQVISVIVTVDVTNVMDAYDKSDRTRSFQDFALNSAESLEIQNRIRTEKARILSLLDEKGVSYTLGEDYDTLISGFEIRIKAGDFDATCKSLGKGEGVIVCEEYKVAETKLVENPVSVYETGIFDSSKSPYDGSGMVVAVLDTGLDSNHSAFSVQNFSSQKLGLTYSQVASVLSQTIASKLFEGLSVDDVYINEKVPFGFDYADEDPDVYSTHNNHGTHVSGVIVGKDDVITGVAPNAQLVSMKIFSDIMDTARASWILSALEDCVVLGVDVINMSLGTACGFSRETDEEILSGVYDKIRAAGISVVVAASNSYSSAYGSEANGNLGLTTNPDTGTVGSPGTYEGVLSVGSINGVETPYIKYGDTIIYFDEANSGAAEELNFFDTLLGEEKSKEMEFVLIPGVGRSVDYTGLDVNGKIVLVRRGDNTFEEKALIAESQGAAGIIIYNNVSGEIKMNVGDAKIAVCSISQDDGEMLAAAASGKLSISRDQSSGPFISDFSSWGPTPSLNIKPEITAHGGNILSSVTGGGYDRLSGTSMACPNLAGVVVLLRQYVVENFPEIANDNVKVNALINQLMMSTADIALNMSGLPYAVRKQGAGLANLYNSLGTKAYIVTYDAKGNSMDKTKIELGDDPNKTGVYELKFTVVNFGDSALSYDLGAYVMTEGVSDTKTNSGKTTVTESGYILDGASIVVSAGGNNGNRITVNAGQSLDVNVTITLSDKDKNYLDTSFANGMYVEGFVTLDAVSGTDIDLNVPYLAYYGDWRKAPLFDLTYFDTNADELDDGINPEDKTMADAYATRPIGGVSADYVSYLGTYYFLQDPKDMVISANKDYIALSNQEGTIHSLRFVWAGLLRNAAKIEISITDDTTGEVVFETVDTDVRKSYGDGGSIYPANIEIEFDTMDYNLANNTEYTVRLVGYLDYGDGGLTTNENNVFEFPLTVDFEAPTVTDVEYYYEYDKTAKKNRLYAKAAIYDNHYAMAAQLGYVMMSTDENGEPMPELKTFEQYMTPIFSQRNGITYVTFELTDYIYELKENAMNGNCFVLSCYDYALNYATYEIGLPDEYVDFYFEGLKEGLTLSPNEVYSLEPLVYPDNAWSELLEFTSSRPSVARIVNNKIVAVSSGIATIKVRDPSTNKSITFRLTVLKEGDEGFRRFDKPVADVFTLKGFYTVKAFYMNTNEDKKLGDTGQTNFFEGNYSLEMYPSESVSLIYDLDAYFPNDTTVEFESSNENIVKIDKSGLVTAVAEGFASVTIRVLQNGQSTYYSETVAVEVKDPFVTNGATLSHYYGNGGLVTIPEKLHLTAVGSFSFSNFNYVEKTPEELAFDDAEAYKQWYIGENTITKVIIPEGVERIEAYAFANLTALEEVVLPSTLESIEYGAFFGCSNLQKITFSGENNLKIINQYAFEGCNLQGTIDLSSVCIISDYAFAGNQKLKGIKTGDSLLSIGQYTFAGCKGLSEVEITAAKVKYGAYAFTGCESLTSFKVNAAVLPEGMFYECKNMTAVTIGADVMEIGEFAFRDTQINSFIVLDGNKAFKTGEYTYILSADGQTLVAVSATASGAFTSANIGNANVTAIGDGAFSHNRKITSVNLPGVTKVGNYGFGSSDKLESVILGKLEQIGEYAFFETAITQLPEVSANTVIGKYAFAYTKLKSVTIPDGATVLEGVFAQCKALESVTIGNNVTIGDYAFNIDKDESYETKYYTDSNGKRFYYYAFSSALKNLTIGNDVTIGDSAFAGHASLQTVTLGSNAKIDRMAFYNCSALRTIDLSKALVIGEYAFSGDEYYICLDENMSIVAVSGEGTYLTTTHAPVLTVIDLSSAESIGQYAFALCDKLTQVTLGDKLSVIPTYAFASCEALKTIDLSKVTAIGDYAFMECAALTNISLASATEVGKYAFVNCGNLANLALNTAGTDIGEGAFAYCAKLANVENLSNARNIGSYAFAYSALTGADLSSAVSIGDMAFMKENLTPFTVKLGSNLMSLGDNPFAMCKVEPFYITEAVTFNGVDYVTRIYTFAISDSVQIIDGSLYCKVPNGLELITYAGVNGEDVQVAEGTVRITSHAFAGSDVKMVTLPYTVNAIGHKAFYRCNQLKTIVFTSYHAPILEEEFDSAYYQSLEHIPGSGDFGTYTDYNGKEVQINGMGLIPYFMWNATGEMYSNVFYGANFVDYVGYVGNKLMMVRPVNGQNYDSFIFDQYFDLRINGATGADDVTLAAIAAINKIPDRVSYEDKAIVEAARAAYNKIATTEQKALVTNYDKLVTAEQRIIALTPEAEAPAAPEVPAKPNVSWMAWTVMFLGVLGVAAALTLEYLREKKKNQNPVNEE
ncbi:MAG: leucine-rich repeat protein [Oscillospiraceae bacterium]|nr:leucine-rich repeat protein [Oscillospiraceae bacterium]